MKTDAATMERVRRVLKKLKMELLYDPVIPHPSVYLKKPKSLVQKNACTLMFIVACLQKPRYGSSPSAHQQRVDKEDVDVVHIYNGILLGHKKE